MGANRFYTPEMLGFIKVYCKTCRPNKLAELFNKKFNTDKTGSQMRTAMQKNGFRSGLPTTLPGETPLLLNPAQIDYLKELYQQYQLPECVERLNKKFGTAFTFKQLRSFTRNHRITSGRTGRYRAGNEAWNKGMKGLDLSGGKGQFKKGNIPHNTRPIGHERIDSKDGYTMVKIADQNPWTGSDTGRFRLKHILIWEAENGPLPEGHVIRFKDGDKANFKLENLVCISRGVHAQLNKQRYNAQPEEIKPALLAIAQLNQKIKDVSEERK